MGFSWSADPAHYHTNDTQASLDNYEFLKNFFAVFSDFSSNDLYLTGQCRHFGRNPAPVN